MEGDVVLIAEQPLTHQTGQRYGRDTLAAAEDVDQTVSREAVPLTPEVHHHLSLDVHTQLGILILQTDHIELLTDGVQSHPACLQVSLKQFPHCLKTLRYEAVSQRRLSLRHYT